MRVKEIVPDRLLNLFIPRCIIAECMNRQNHLHVSYGLLNIWKIEKERESVRG
jgi:hypothetical protein